MKFIYPIVIYECPDCLKAFPVLAGDHAEPVPKPCPRCGCRKTTPAKNVADGKIIVGELSLTVPVWEAP